MEDLTKKPEEYIQLTQELLNKCLEYMHLRGGSLGTQTKSRYSKDLKLLFANKVLTQPLYNKMHSKGGINAAILNLVQNTSEHFDLPNYKYKKVVAKKKSNYLPQVWREPEIIRMIDEIEEYGLLVSCAYYIGAGLRFSSAIMLSWDDFHWEDWIEDKTKIGSVTIVAKGNQQQNLIVDPILMNQLYNLANRRGKCFQGIPYKNSDNDLYLFVKRVELEALQEAFKKKNFENNLDNGLEEVNVKESAKFELIKKKHYLVDYRLRKLSKKFNNRPIKFHSIRHSRATNLLRKGFKLMTIKKQLMHKSITSTEIYLNLSDVDMDDEFNEKL